MTSNIGSTAIADLQGRDADEMERRVMEALNAHFRPEFINRIDDVIIFHPLSREQLRSIVSIQIQRLSSLLHERGIDLTLTEAALELLAGEGYDPVYGARPLKRVIQKRIQDVLAIQILSGKFNDGDAIFADAKNGELVFEKESAEVQ
jgi:ATP-dependent Clp protease ATP-binding subunit ClpB